MNGQFLHDAWLSAFDDVAPRYDAMVDPPRLEGESALDRAFDDAFHAGDLPGAIMAIGAWKDAWNRVLGTKE